jgi:FtsP/CotA-like multicopper oxidase with cupredoxin domain
MGLYGQHHVTDALEQSLPIPHGEFDVPLLVGDATFNADGSLLFDNHDQSGVYGDVILVNGRPWPVMQVKRRKYRFRILNASVSRSYEWWLDSGEPLTVIATDGGLIPYPQVVQSLRHGMAERYEVIIDFAAYPAGRRVVLQNSSPKNNQDAQNTDKVMAFDVVADDFDPIDNTIPDELDPAFPVMLLTEAGAIRTRSLEFKRQHGQWTIDGNTWDDVVESDFTLCAAEPSAGDVEIWELRNSSGGWFHPVHIHLVDFQILDRNGRPPLPHERGPKDVVYVGEDNAVRLLMKFEGRGRYMIHCHNLVHEDHDMMAQFDVLDPDVAEEGPFSAPAAWLPAAVL